MSDARPENVRVAPPRRKKRRHRVSRPLEVTPPLGRGSYVFPLVGPSSYGDSYGGFRGDVHGKWHHGDDIFASLGTPVVAVANGTVNRVGWHKVGGWRLWVRDAAADEFYFAHLSGYAPSILRSNRVTAGQVIGFVGNTGDAYGGAPHLHFEVHPRQLLRLRYDGAVDPTAYLDSWPHLQSVDAPFPVHPRLPRQPRFRSEARYVFRRLLVARHLIERPPTPSDQPKIDMRRGLIAASPPPLVRIRELPAPTVVARSSTLTIPLLAGLLSVAVFVAMTVLGGMVLIRAWR